MQNMNYKLICTVLTTIQHIEFNDMCIKVKTRVRAVFVFHIKVNTF